LARHFGAQKFRAIFRASGAADDDDDDDDDDRGVRGDRGSERLDKQAGTQQVNRRATWSFAFVRYRRPCLHLTSLSGMAAMATSAIMPPAADAPAAPSAADGDDATTPPPTSVITDSMRAEEAALQAASECEMQVMAQTVRRWHLANY